MHPVPDAVGNSGPGARAATAHAFNIKPGAVYFTHSSESCRVPTSNAVASVNSVRRTESGGGCSAALNHADVADVADIADIARFFVTFAFADDSDSRESINAQ
jgi:hypothetical protein